MSRASVASCFTDIIIIIIIIMVVPHSRGHSRRW